VAWASGSYPTNHTHAPPQRACPTPAMEYSPPPLSHATRSQQPLAMPTPEGDVLLPVKSTINSDNWEIFVLSDVQVVYESNGRPASLLAAYADTPLKVQGRLEAPERGQLKYRESFVCASSAI
jgi:hypothetical protein